MADLIVSYLTESAIHRFWKKVQKTENCWIWTGSLNHGGYGRFGFHRLLTHRISWTIHNGEIPRGLCVLHDCPGGDNRKCVNPDHLWLGTLQDNNADRHEKGNSKGGPHFGRDNPKYKEFTSEQRDEAQRLYYGGLTLKQVASILDISYSFIQRVIAEER